MPPVESNWTVFNRRLLQFSATEVIVDNMHSRPLLLQRRRHRLTMENPRKAKLPSAAVLLERKVKDHAEKSSKEIVRIRRVTIGILPNVKIAYLYRDENSATNACLDTLRLMGSPAKSRRGVEGKGQLPR